MESMAGENHYATSSRRKILEILKASKDRTVTAAQIGEQLRQMESEVNITTVYRYLDKLEKDGTVIRYASEQGGQAAYQYVEQGQGCEGHLADHLQSQTVRWIGHDAFPVLSREDFHI